jgi:hypothetical protein
MQTNVVAADLVPLNGSIDRAEFCKPLADRRRPFHRGIGKLVPL